MGFDNTDRDLLLDDQDKRDAKVLFDLARWMHGAWSSGAPIDGEAVTRILRAVMARSGMPSSADPIARARREIEKHYASGLYLHHFAETIGMNRTTFLRRFASRYGLTPVQYRISVQLNEANRLALLDSTMTTDAIASACGFDSTSYFHRAFKRYFGASVSRRRKRG